MGPMRQNPIQRTVRSVHMCVHRTVHNYCTQYCTEQTWWFSLLPSRRSSLLRWCLFDGRGPRTCPVIHTFTSHVDRVKPDVIYMQLQCRLSPVIDRLHSLVTQVCQVQLVHGWYAPVTSWTRGLMMISGDCKSNGITSKIIHYTHYGVALRSGKGQIPLR